MDFPEESAEELYDNAPFGYVSFLADGEIVKVNKTFLEWFAITKEQVLFKRKIQDFLKIGGKIYFETHFFPLLKMQGYIKEVQFDLIKDNGNTIPALINVNKLEKPNSKVVVYRASIVDITDRKKYEQVLIDQKKKAEENAQAKAEFLSIISHEIRTPLNAIVGVGNLIQNTHLDQKQQEYARLLQLSSNNLLELVNNLLDLSKLESHRTTIQKKEFNFKELLEVLVTTYRIKAKEKNIRLETDFADNLPYLLIGDPIKLKQVLTNLIGNAIKFTREGTVLFKVKIEQQEQTFVSLDFRVEDTGIGIPPDKLERIFDEFSQASYEVNMEFGGTGLGLTISQKLLQLQGSELKVQSEEGRGSAFSFKLSFHIPQETVDSPALSKVKKELRALSGKVLVVDDNETNLFIISRYLEDWKISFSTANSGTKAIQKAEKNNYDVILMDLHMPQMNGFETTKEILAKKGFRKPAVVALSASGRGDMDVKLRRAGMSAYVSKPFNPEELQEVLWRFLPKENKMETPTPTESVNTALKTLSEDGFDGSYDLSRIKNISKNNTKIFYKLVNSFIKSIKLYQEEFSVASKGRDLKKLNDLIHKNKTTVHYLKAETLSHQIDLFLKLLEESNIQQQNLDKQRALILSEFREINQGLTNLQV